MFLERVVRKNLWLKSCEEVLLKINYFTDIFSGFFLSKAATQRCSQQLYLNHFLAWVFSCKFIAAEAVAWRCSVKNVFLKISQNSQENTGSGRLQHRCLPKNFTNFFKNTYLSEPLLLEQLYYYFPYFFSKFFHVFLLTKVINKSCKKLLQNFAIFTEKHLCQGLFLIMLQS